MVTVSKEEMRSSAYVAPLHIFKNHSRDLSDDSGNGSQYTSRTGSSQGGPSTYHSQITPPITPNGSQEDLAEHVESSAPVFHAFFRAFCPYHPTYAISDSTVTLPLNEGDVILVHSIHTNGWADGTLLLSGARGWLPTNYCEAYEPEPMRSLLKALLNFWDLLRSGLSSDNEIFGNQEFMRGLIAGVRYLLERSDCLTRESHMVKSNDMLRRNRKALLSDLSALVKVAKRLQEYTMKGLLTENVDVNDLVDEMILKAFKIVTRGVRFLDVLEDDPRSQTMVLSRPMPILNEESSVPPTPPADSTSFNPASSSSDVASRRVSSRSSTTDTSSSNMSEEQSQSQKRLSTAYSKAVLSGTSGVQSASNVNKRFSATVKRMSLNRLSITHRMSTAGAYVTTARHNLMSEKLSACHDNLLSYLGSFIGRLHLQSQLSHDLISTIRQSILAGRELITIVEMVCSHDSQSEDSLYEAKDIMVHCINQVILAARECVRPVGGDEDERMTPQENARLKEAATDCVVAAGDCVAKTKFVIERIGDFEFDTPLQGLGIELENAPVIQDQPAERDPQVTTDSPTSPPEPKTRPPPPPLTISSIEKPLPIVPAASPVVPSHASSQETISEIETTPKRSSRSLLPPLPRLTSPLLSNEDYSPSDHSSVHDGDFQSSFRFGSLAVSSGTNSTYMSGARDSESSLISQTSTRATTPDHSPYAPSHQSSFSNLSNSESQTTLADDADYGESKILEKTFAHELLFNKEGQVTGGSLSALVEKLTTHDSTPDAIFVSTFYLTFRLFASAVKFAEALVDRFDYVAQSPHIATPVRLRVYNVFKGWLESHWKEDADHKALSIIEPFAQDKLALLLPAAGKRLLELARKVSSTNGTLVPRLVSSMGKTNTSISQYISPDTPLPQSIMSKSATSVLKNWKMGGSAPTILDFDPLEFARQLTVKEMNIFCCIMPEELLASEWMKKTGSNATNVKAMSTLFNDISNLVADTILQYEDTRKRATVIKHWIKIAEKCLELNNYDSLMAVLCSLNASTIARLKRTWDVVSQKRKDTLKLLQDLVEPTKNHAVLRQRLHDHVPPCLPFVGTYLTDLYFVDIGNPPTKQLPGIGEATGLTVINFDKHSRTAKIIGELQRFQIPYRLAEVPAMQEWIQAQIVRVRCANDQDNDQKFYRKSLLLEPRLAPTMKTSPVEYANSFPPAQSGTKEKFDIFAWSHLGRDKSAATSTAPSAAASGTVTPV